MRGGNVERSIRVIGLIEMDAQGDHLLEDGAWWLDMWVAILF